MEIDVLMGKFREMESEVPKLAADLIKIPSVNPPGDMTEIAGYIRDYLSKYGIECQLKEPEKGKINIISRYGETNDIELMLNGHMDVVPPGDEDKWTYPPFSGIIRDGYLYGRGASDMKGALAALIISYIAAVNYVENIEKTISLALVPDEETGSSRGTQYLIKDLGLRPKYILIGEPSTLYAYNMGEKGILWYKIRVRGIPGHASASPYIGDNAILKSADIIKDIYSLTKIDFEPPTQLKEIAKVSGELVSSVIGKPELKRIFTSLSCNIGLIKGGVKTNVIAPDCELDFDMRIPHGLTVDDVINLVKEKLSRYGESIEIEKVAGEDPSYTDPYSKLISAITSSVKEELNVIPVATLIQGATDARHFRMEGGEAVIYGPAEWKGVHGYNERIKVEDLIHASRIYLRIIHKMISQ
jgi:succinyl-diaminopimelate desuccinylase